MAALKLGYTVLVLVTYFCLPATAADCVNNSVQDFDGSANFTQLAVNDLSTRNHLVFAVKGKKDCILRLYGGASSSSNFLSIHVDVTIGGNDNTQSMIQFSVPSIAYSRNLDSFTHNPLSRSQFRRFWVSWGVSRVSVGYGDTPGQQTFMEASRFWWAWEVTAVKIAGNGVPFQTVFVLNDGNCSKMDPNAPATSAQSQYSSRPISDPTAVSKATLLTSRSSVKISASVTASSHLESAFFPLDTTSVHLGSTSFLLDSTSLPLDTNSLPPDTTSLAPDTTSLPLDTTSLPLDTASLHMDTTSLVPGITFLPLDTSFLPLNTVYIHLESTFPLDTTSGISSIPTSVSSPPGNGNDASTPAGLTSADSSSMSNSMMSSFTASWVSPNPSLSPVATLPASSSSAFTPTPSSAVLSFIPIVSSLPTTPLSSQPARRCCCSTTSSPSTNWSVTTNKQKVTPSELNLELLDKRTLSASVRRRTSAPDHRPESVALGVGGIILVTLPLLLTVLSDLFTCLGHWHFARVRSRRRGRRVDPEVSPPPGVSGD